MDTSSDRTLEQQECRFRWGMCTTELRGVGSHLCRERNIMVNGKELHLHSTLHCCQYCGAVYVIGREPDFKPMRDDAVVRWLKAWRDNFPDDEFKQLIDDILDDYREHADTGTPLDAVIERDKT